SGPKPPPFGFVAKSKSWNFAVTLRRCPSSSPTDLLRLGSSTARTAVGSAGFAEGSEQAAARIHGSETTTDRTMRPRVDDCFIEVSSYGMVLPPMAGGVVGFR